MLEKILIVVVVLTLGYAGIRFVATGTSRALECQGRRIVNADGTVSCSAGAGPASPPAAKPPPAAGAPVCRNGDCSICFVAGTPVVTAAGAVPIEQIVPGTVVLSRRETGGQNHWKPVVQTFVTRSRSLLRLTLMSAAGLSDSVDVTPNHPFYSITRGWAEARDLVAGEDLLVDGDGLPIRIAAIDLLPRPVPVYNFEVADDHTYFVGQLGIWVHNLRLRRPWRRTPRPPPNWEIDPSPPPVPNTPVQAPAPLAPTPDHVPAVPVDGHGGEAPPPSAPADHSPGPLPPIRPLPLVPLVRPLPAPPLIRPLPAPPLIRPLPEPPVRPLPPEPPVRPLPPPPGEEALPPYAPAPPPGHETVDQPQPPPYAPANQPLGPPVPVRPLPQPPVRPLPPLPVRPLPQPPAGPLPPAPVSPGEETPPPNAALPLPPPSPAPPPPPRPPAQPGSARPPQGIAPVSPPTGGDGRSRFRWGWPPWRRPDPRPPGWEIDPDPPSTGPQPPRPAVDELGPLDNDESLPNTCG